MNKRKEKEFTLTLKNDYLFKRLLSKEENKWILQDFLECSFHSLPETFDEFELLDKELKKDKIEDKMGVLDTHIRLKSGTHIDLEMQHLWTSEFVSRSFFYVSKMYTEDFTAGSSYSNLNKCISANIVAEGFNLSKKIHSEFVPKEKETNEMLGDIVEFHFFNLEKVKDLPVSYEDTKENRLNMWLKFIDAEKKEERCMIASTSSVLKALNEQINTLTLTKEERMLYDSRMKLKSDIATISESRFNEGIKKGIEKGMQQGIEQGKIETAINLIALGLSKDKIAQATGLSEEKVATLL